MGIDESVRRMVRGAVFSVMSLAMAFPGCYRDPKPVQGPPGSADVGVIGKGRAEDGTGGNGTGGAAGAGSEVSGVAGAGGAIEAEPGGVAGGAAATDGAETREAGQAAEGVDKGDMPGDEPGAGEGNRESEGAAGTGEVGLGRVRGLVTDQGNGAPDDGLGGQGTRGRVVAVQARGIREGGPGATLGTADLAQDGRFELKLSADAALGTEPILVEAVDGSGRVLGSAVAVLPRGSAQEVLAPPLGTTSSVVSQVVVRALDCSSKGRRKAHGASIALFASAFVNADLAAAMVDAMEQGLDRDLAIEALAEATVTAAEAFQYSLTYMGLALNTDALARVQGDTLIRYNGALLGVYDGQLTEAATVGRLASDLLRVADQAAGASLDVAALAQIAADLAFSASISATFAGYAMADTVLFPSDKAVAMLEVPIVATTLMELLMPVAGSEALAAVRDACDAFLQAAAAATSRPELRAARELFVDALVDPQLFEQGLPAGLLGEVAEVVDSLFGSLLDSIASLTLTLQRPVQQGDVAGGLTERLTCVTPGPQAGGPGDVGVGVPQLVQGLAAFRVDIDALADELMATGVAEGHAQRIAAAAGLAGCLVQ